MKTVTEYLLEVRKLIETMRERYICHAIRRTVRDAELKGKLIHSVGVLINYDITLLIYLDDMRWRGVKPEWLDDENWNYDPDTTEIGSLLYVRARLNLIDYMLKLEAEGKLPLGDRNPYLLNEESQ